AAEAPPAVVSMFLGEELTDILEAIETDTAYDNKEKVLMKVGVHALPRFPKDTTDRNRTSPFAFTGNKFEFRMLGSTASIANPNTILNTIVAEVLSQFADELEQAEDFNTTLHDLIVRTIKAHKRIIFNGNGYDNAWLAEAAKRGLSNYVTTPDCLPHFADEKNIALFEKHRVFTRQEVLSRCEIQLESYCKILNIEAQTMLDMALKDILPAATAYVKELSETVVAKKAAVPGAVCAAEEALITTLSSLTSSLYQAINHLKGAIANTHDVHGSEALAFYYRDHIVTAMQELRRIADEIETRTAKPFWPYPTYDDLLYSVQ
ncbi:MAG: glutamine synthetase type III, partial [Clostridia bacterium]|nr:glutamine synthetase type III [Clostridia bacterium]